MGLIYKNNSPVKFITGNYVGHNSRDCFPDLHQFCQKVERADVTPYQIQVTSVGSDLVGDSGFAQPCGVTWTCGANWNVGGATANKTAGGANNLTQAIQIMNLRYYRVRFDLISISGGNLTVRLGGNLVATYTPASATGTQTEWVRVVAITGHDIEFAGQTATVCSIDNVNVFEFSQIGYEIEDTDGLTIFNSLGTISPTRFEDESQINTRWIIGDIPNEGCYVICNHDISDYLEMIVNGAFLSAYNWTLGGGWGIAAGVAGVAAALPATMSQTFHSPLLASRCYTLNFDMLNWVVGELEVVLQPSGINLGSFSGNGAKTAPIDLTGFPNQTSIDFNAVNAIANTFDIDNVSIQMQTACYEEDACSECYELADDWDDHQICTHLLTWTNTENAFGFEYANLGMVQSLRLQSQVWKPHYPETRLDYENSAGTRDILYGKSDKISGLDIDVVPEYLHDALRLMRIHDTITLDGDTIVCEAGDYEPDWKGNTEVGSALIDIRAKTENNTNENC